MAHKIKKIYPGVSSKATGGDRCGKLNDLSDDVLTKATLLYYSDPRDALIKGLAE